MKRVGIAAGGNWIVDRIKTVDRLPGRGAGMLYGLHEDWSHADSARLAACCAAATLAEDGATDGMKPVPEVLELAERFPERPPPVKI